MREEGWVHFISTAYSPARIEWLVNSILSELCKLKFQDLPILCLGIPGTRGVEEPHGYRNLSSQGLLTVKAFTMRRS